MPHLLCQEHGREQEARCIEEQQNYQRFGEAVLIVSGPLKSPSHRCRICDVRLRRGQRAWLITAFPRFFPGDLDRYDYANEGDIWSWSMPRPGCTGSGRRAAGRRSPPRRGNARDTRAWQGPQAVVICKAMITK